MILGLLFVEAVLVGSWVSGIARDEAAAAADIPLDRVEVDGLDITLTGFTDEAERDAAVAAVDALESSDSVIGLMARSAVPASTDASTEDSTDASTEDSTEDSAPALPPTEIDLVVAADSGVTLQGVVSSEQVRSDVLALAETHFGRGSITDELTVDEEGVGSVGGAIVVGGQVGSDDQRGEVVASAMALAIGLGYELSDELEVATVADVLNELFVLEPIEFDARRATIRPAARVTLDEAAALLNERADGGNLLVIGHTDSDGRASRNLDLSQLRAQAVVDYLVSEGGVDPARLEAKGVGEEQLLVSPEKTANDKQRNRRIEWELAS
ncbi:MAG: OmpA family protein [Actinomycetia bacterium]|nr:OmpA family protein [Actinomycetes bacterium]